MNHKSLSVYIPVWDKEAAYHNYNTFKSCSSVNTITLITNEPDQFSSSIKKIKTEYFFSTDVIEKICSEAVRKYILFLYSNSLIDITDTSLKRMIAIADNSGAGLIYSDYYIDNNGRPEYYPLNDYQSGSVRDDFDFGEIMMFSREVLLNNPEKKYNYKYSGLYDLRLSASRNFPVLRIPEPLYISKKIKIDKQVNKQFEYLKTENKLFQIEYEQVFTDHLKKINAYLPPPTKQINFGNENLKYEASIIIPVKNRINTVEEAIKSALAQQTDFNFNVIVIDNHSTDGTTKVINRIAGNDKRVIHIIPERCDLNIGGCWNEGINHPECGKFSVQLDSDDIYSDNTTLQKIVDKFCETKCAMVIGSYKLTDFNFNDIPPGIIDHNEWSEENGHNNLLRLNGLGAPRAFYTKLLRKIGFPNVSYGEDYAVALAITREYKISRIYEPMYICRRWEGNSDSSFSIEKQNKNNHYKDFIRTQEILIRQKFNLLKLQNNLV